LRRRRPSAAQRSRSSACRKGGHRRPSATRPRSSARASSIRPGSHLRAAIRSAACGWSGLLQRPFGPRQEARRPAVASLASRTSVGPAASARGASGLQPNNLHHIAKPFSLYCLAPFGFHLIVFINDATTCDQYYFNYSILFTNICSRLTKIAGAVTHASRIPFGLWYWDFKILVIFIMGPRPYLYIILMENGHIQALHQRYHLRATYYMGHPSP